MKRSSEKTRKKARGKSGVVWKPLHKGRSPLILHVAFQSPIAVMEALAWDDVPEGSKQQAEDILEQLRSVRPCCRNPDDWGFVIKRERNGAFLDFRVVKKAKSKGGKKKKRKPKLGPGEYLSDYLNLASREYERREDRMMECFHKHYFGGAPTRKQMVDFILNLGMCRDKPLAIRNED